MADSPPGELTDREKAMMHAIAEITAPLEKRIDELERVVRALVQSAAGRHE